jgi:hypothetical protein
MRLFLLFLLSLAGLDAAETYRDPNAWKFYADHPEFFHFARPEELPKDLVWHEGAAQQEFADPRALRGGALRQAVITSPPTRTTGSAATSTTTMISACWRRTRTRTSRSRRSPCAGRSPPTG